MDRPSSLDRGVADTRWAANLAQRDQAGHPGFAAIRRDASTPEQETGMTADQLSKSQDTQLLRAIQELGGSANSVTQPAG